MKKVYIPIYIFFLLVLSSSVYGVSWDAGESVGVKTIQLDDDAIYDFNHGSTEESYLQLRDRFRVGFWEYDDKLEVNYSHSGIGGNGLGCQALFKNRTRCVHA